MLQSVRDNLKGTFVAGIVILFFIVPLVFTGFDGGSYFGSVAGTDAAVVDGKNISTRELNRAVFMRKQRMLQQQGVDPTADYLKDENLRGPVLDTLTRRAALVVAAEKGGMSVSSAVLDDQITKAPEFQKDGRFDMQTYQRLLSNIGYTSAGYKAALAEDSVLNQHATGIDLSSFATQQELDSLVSLVQQKRSFFTITIPKAKVEGEVSVTDEEIQAHYDANQTDFVDAEKMSAEYIEISVDAIAKTIEITEDKIKDQYDAEVAQFSKPDAYEVAHILIEEKDNQADLVAEVSSKIAAGEDFAALVKEYSDDLGSKESGGSLGVLTTGTFPEEFEKAAFALGEGEVSAPVVTDAGTHFVKVLSITKETPPTFEGRKDAIAKSLKTAEAEDLFAQQLEKIGDLTFSAPDLSDAAKEFGIKVQTTPFFTRDGGPGLGANAEFRKEAFSNEVLDKGYNSKVIEISNTKAVVLRKSAHSPERVKSLNEVKAQITAKLTKQKTDEALAALVDSAIEKVKTGTDAEAVAKESEYEFKSYELADRASSDAGFQVVGKAFSMSLDEGAASFDSVTSREGNHVVVGLTNIVAGAKDDMPEQQFKGLAAQLKQQNASFEGASYEAEVFSTASIKIK